VPSTLYMLVFGESVLNDAVAVVLFRTFVELRKEQITPSLMALAFGKFVLLAVGSVFVGTAFGLLSAFIFKHLQLRAFPSLEFSLVCIFAYFPYLLAEVLGRKVRKRLAHIAHVPVSLNRARLRIGPWGSPGRGQGGPNNGSHITALSDLQLNIALWCVGRVGDSLASCPSSSVGLRWLITPTVISPL